MHELRPMHAVRHRLAVPHGRYIAKGEGRMGIDL
jgi:hypothetical protein